MFDKICSNSVFEGFTPTDQFFDFKYKWLRKKVHNKKVTDKAKKSKKLTRAINNELKDRYKLKDDESFYERRKIHKDSLDLRFVINDQKSTLTATNLEDKIEREITKTKDQKIHDFEKRNPSLPMIGGGRNDVLHGIF